MGKGKEASLRRRHVFNECCIPRFLLESKRAVDEMFMFKVEGMETRPTQSLVPAPSEPIKARNLARGKYKGKVV